MKKIEIVTFNKAHNYGATLQAYALERKISDLKYEVDFLNYYDEFIENGYKIFKISKKHGLLGVVKSFLSSVVFYKINKKRFYTFNDFINNNLKINTKYYKSICELKNNTPEVDVLITGSDQVWNSKITGGLSDVYTLNFGNDGIKRISYAASVGDINLIKDNEEEYKKKISKIDYISVRENDAKEALSEIIDKPIKVVLDPTLLLTKKEWDDVVNKISNTKEKYILAYVVEPDEEYIKIANDLSKKTGLRIIHFGKKNPGYNNVLKSAYTEGPLEFINYIKNAEYVVATSFHATVFSIIFNKKFFIVPHRKTGARVTNLLDNLEIKGRTFSSYEDFKDIDYDFDTDWTNVKKILDKEREESINWLKNAIEG